MIGVHGIMVDKNKMLIKTVHYKLETLPKESKDKFIIVDSVPEKIQLKGKRIKQYINTKTKEITVEYEDRPLSQEESLGEISAKLSELIEETKKLKAG